jgi:diacylglycerol kinase family enzyme
MLTSGPLHAHALARQAAAEGADLVLVLGGDGTINEAAQGLAHTGVPLGVLPGGTANVLATELGLGSRPEAAAARLAQCSPAVVALGRVATAAGPRYFLSMCGAGLDAAIIEDLAPGLKAAAGKLAYWIVGFAQVRRRVGQLSARVEGTTFTCGFALASRVRNYGGDLEIASGASLLRDDFEVVLFEGSNPLRYAWYMLGVVTGRVQRMRGVRTLRAGSVELLSSAPWQIDGELLGHGPAAIDVVPRALTLMVPRGYG